jgi:hypothetical protein
VIESTEENSMRIFVRQLALGLVILAIASPALAQEGHPLIGTWSGDWGEALNNETDNQTHVTVVLRYDDNNQIGGLINPGRNSITITSVVLDPADWTVAINATTSDPNAAPIRIEGQLEDLESYHRTLTGTWEQGGVESELLLTRD